MRATAPRLRRPVAHGRLELSRGVAIPHRNPCFPTWDVSVKMPDLPMLSSTPCALCGNATYGLVHDLGWRRVLKCAQCGLVRADPLPSLAEKEEIETKGYTED